MSNLMKNTCSLTHRSTLFAILSYIRLILLACASNNTLCGRFLQAQKVIMSAKKLLNGEAYQVYGEEDDDYFYEEEYVMNKPLKITLYGLFVCVCVGCIWFFAIFLPGYFIPEARALESINKVTDLKVALKPLSEGRVKQLGLWDGEREASDGVRDSEIWVNESESDEEIEIGGSGIDIEGGVEMDQKRVVERIILIGDVHGHYTKLRKLLRKLNFRRRTDHVLMLGDFIAKGPDSIKVLEFAIDNKIDCIFGNHELYVLQNYAKFHQLDAPRFTEGESDIRIEGLFNEDPEYLLAKKLEPHHIDYINKCLVIKKLGKVPVHGRDEDGGLKYTNGVAVHGGLRWDIPFEEQDSEKCLEMRSYIGPYFNESTDDPFEENAVSWSKIWNKKQKEMPKKDTHVVYYGHDARRGLKLKKYSKGLDTGCYKGGRLTAMVIWNEKITSTKGVSKILHKEKIVSVPC